MLFISSQVIFCTFTVLNKVQFAKPKPNKTPRSSFQCTQITLPFSIENVTHLIIRNLYSKEHV